MIRRKDVADSAGTPFDRCKSPDAPYSAARRRVHLDAGVARAVAERPLRYWAILAALDR